MDSKQDIIDAVRDAGVTGAGGACFPTFVKLQAKVEYYIANGVECEPLAQADKELMRHKAGEVIAGMRAGMQATSAPRGIIGIKKKYQEIIQHLKTELAGVNDITITEVGNFYPAGDEHVLVYDATGRVVPEGGLPINVGCVVQNIETLLNIKRALDGQPFTHKYITVIGAVQQPLTVRVPLGITLREVIALAGGPNTPDPVVLEGGAMMGSVVTDLESPVTKRTKLLLVLPYDHQLSVKRRTPVGAFDRQAISACDQCFMCTDFCPRYAQGHAIQPHKLILLMSSGLPLTDEQMSGALLCCECRTCNYACPVHLSPGDIAIHIKHDLVKGGLKNPHHRQTEVDPYREYRRVPIIRLISRLGLKKYDVHAPLTDVTGDYSRAVLPLRQHIGLASEPVVAVGERVNTGTTIAKIPAGALGVPLHASINGVVTKIHPDFVVIEAR